MEILFEPRLITSVYFDTVDLKMFHDSEEGVLPRKKIRIRWYNNDLKRIYLEEKNKRNFYVWKNVSKMNIFTNKNNLISDLKKNIFDPKNITTNNYNFVLQTNYKRNYWLSNNGKIRATIDTEINTSPAYDLTRVIELPETILEFKFSTNSEAFFRDFLSQKGLNIRSKKYSKYLQSFITLEESGLIN